MRFLRCVRYLVPTFSVSGWDDAVLAAVIASTASLATGVGSTVANSVSQKKAAEKQDQLATLEMENQKRKREQQMQAFEQAVETVTPEQRAERIGQATTAAQSDLSRVLADSLSSASGTGGLEGQRTPEYVAERAKAASSEFERAIARARLMAPFMGRSSASGMESRALADAISRAGMIGNDAQTDAARTSALSGMIQPDQGSMIAGQSLGALSKLASAGGQIAAGALK